MNATSPIPAAVPLETFASASESAAAWRGRCLDVFSRCETAVTETLLCLAAAKRDKSIKLPHLVGQRYDALSSAISAGGPFAGEAKGASDALAKFRQHDALRTQLTHGVFTVTLDHRGSWHIVGRVTALRSGRKSSNLFATNQYDAGNILIVLVKDGARLRSTLGQFRHALSKAQPLIEVAKFA